MVTTTTKAPIVGCSASSKYPVGDDYNCSKAFDGNVHSDWATHGQGVGSWIKLDFAEPATISAMAYTNRWSTGERNRAVRLEFSDGSAQNVVLDNTNTPGYFRFKEVTTTYVKITVETVYASSNNGAREIAFWKHSVKTSASGSLGQHVPNNLADGKKETMWHSNTHTTTSWWQAEFDQDITLLQFRLTPRQDGQTGHNQAFKVMVGDTICRDNNPNPRASPTPHTPHTHTHTHTLFALCTGTEGRFAFR